MTHPNSPLRIGCVIPAAGAGTRFGEPKAGAEFTPGVRFIDRIVDLARSAGINDIVAVLHSAIAPPEGIRSVTNPNPQSEQLTSIKLGLAQLTGVPVHGTLVWPVDHPHVLPSTVLQIIETVQSANPQLVLPTFRGKHGHPVYFARDLWRELVTTPTGGAKEVVHRHLHEAIEMHVEDAGVIRDVNRRGE